MLTRAGILFGEVGVMAVGVIVVAAVRVMFFAYSVTRKEINNS